MENDEYIVIFPAYEALKQETERLRTELSMLFLEKDELLCVECKNIEMQYMLELGAVEYKAYQAQCAALRARRKLELIRAKRNRQETVSIQQIEAWLDEEFADYQKKLEEQIEKMNAALHRSQSKVLSEAEAKELKKLYRKIVKALHPDLHPDLTDARKELFLNASKAYENGDLNALRIIAEMTPEVPETGGGANTMDMLAREKQRLISLLESVRESIQSIRSSYPYILKGLLANPEKVELKRQELQNILEQYQRQTDYCLAEIEKLLR